MHFCIRRSQELKIFLILRWATLHRWAISHLMLIDHSWQVGWHCQHGSLAQDSSRFADHALHGLWGRHHLLLSRLGNIGMQLWGGGTRSGTFLQSHWRQILFLRKKDLQVGFSIFGLFNVQVRSLALPSIVKKQMSGRWSWISHCHQDFVLGCFGLLAVFGWPSTSTWSKRLFFQNSQSQSFSAVILINTGEYCDIAKSDAIGCPLVKAMVWISCFGWPMLTNMPKKSVFLSPPSPTLACFLEFVKCCAFVKLVIINYSGLCSDEFNKTQ